MSFEFRDFYTPERFKGRTGLQIFVDRFYRVGNQPERMEGKILKEWGDASPNWKPDEDGIYRNNYFYGGNLQGIMAKLDYIEWLNFNILYLSPLSFTQSSHHYDVEDQRILDPWIGTWRDFNTLCVEAHKRDILICVDLVFNHMGINSFFFQEALKNKSSPYHQWFEWDAKGEPVFWFGFKDMPQCNKLNPNYQDYVFDVIERYLREGADAIRLDLGENFPKEFMVKLRNKTKKINPEALIVIEMWDLATKKENSQMDGMQTDSVMNYPLADAICRWVRYGNAQHFAYTIGELKSYPQNVQAVLWNFLDSHDTPRAINMLAAKGMLENPFEGRIWDIEAPWRKAKEFDTYGFRKWEQDNDKVDMEIARKKLIMASTIQYFMPGIPIVYAGTEIGMTGYKDPFNRKPYNWQNPDRNLLEHYQKLGLLRKENRKFFSKATSLECEVYQTSLKITRQSENGQMILIASRESENQGTDAKVEVYKKVF